MGNRWELSGRYGDIVWPRADTVVWLNYSLPLILWRLTRRTFRRAVLKEEYLHGNRGEPTYAPVYEGQPLLVGADDL